MNMNPSLEHVADKKEEEPAFSDVSSFLLHKGKNLMETPEEIKHSNVIAFEVAKYLINEGKNPEIRCIQAKEENGYRKPISFKKLPGMEIQNYSVCVVEDTVFDPLYGEPALLADYLANAFATKEVEEIPMYPKDRIEGMFRK